MVQQGSANERMGVTGGYFRQDADTPYLLSLVRHQVNGELDSTFLTPGKGTVDLPDNTEDFPGRFLRQPGRRPLDARRVLSSHSLHRHALHRLRSPRSRLRR